MEEKKEGRKSSYSTLLTAMIDLGQAHKTTWPWNCEHVPLELQGGTQGTLAWKQNSMRMKTGLREKENEAKS